MSASASVAAEAWAARVRAGREQIERLREVEEPADFYGPMAQRFALDPHRSDDEALDVLRSLARTDETWLDIGAGGGRYALPLALVVRRVVALEPSPAMLGVLRAGLAEHGITNVEVIADEWPPREALDVDVALMAHVGYDIEAFGVFLDAAEDSARRCVAIMRTSGSNRLNALLFPAIHGEPRLAYPMLPELVELLAARGTEAEVTLVDRGNWGFSSREQLVEAARRLLYLRPGSPKDRQLEGLVAERAAERDGRWDIDWMPMQDGIVTWTAL
jgi:SAM-dependent methyltransferase